MTVLIILWLLWPAAVWREIDTSTHTQGLSNSQYVAVLFLKQFDYLAYKRSVQSIYKGKSVIIWLYYYVVIHMTCLLFADSGYGLLAICEIYCYIYEICYLMKWEVSLFLSTFFFRRYMSHLVFILLKLNCHPWSFYSRFMMKSMMAKAYDSANLCVTFLKLVSLQFVP